MAGYFDDSVIENVRQQVNIVDVIGQYVELSRKGKNYMGLCPFHEEKTPSFSVSEDKQLYHCFSCGRAGNLFKFIMDIEDMNFQEAVRKIAQDANIELPDNQRSVQEKSSVSYKLKKMYQEAEVFYAHILNATKTGIKALDYLKGRQITAAAIESFGLGYAPDVHNILLEYLQQQDFTADELRASGLFVENDNGELFDRFRDRVMFPLKDQSGQIIAFSGRKLNQDSNQPKYLNSPETKIFTKSKLLFNFDQAKTTLKNDQHLILFEGYMDVISATQAGVKNGIASMGTSLTDEQIYAIRRVTNKLILAYDGDQPGQKATERALVLFNEKNFDLEVGVVTLPEQLDPDEFIKKYGAEKFRHELQGAVTPTEFRLKVLQQKYNLANDREKVEYGEEAVKLIATVNSPVAAEIYLNQLADQLSVSTDALKGQLVRVRRLNRQVQRRSQNTQAQNQQGQSSYGPEPMQNQATGVDTAISRAERRLLYLQLHYDEVMEYLHEQNFEFQDQNFAKIANLWENFRDTHDNIKVDSFLDYVPEELKSIIVNVEMSEMPEDYSMDEVDDYLAAFAKERVRRQIASLTDELNEAKRKHDEDAEVALTQKIITLQRMMRL
ncbi:DNA primase [Amylolactobacillus amylotrophicus DSM 20534]|uniref:DNA primase n=4 Tax=Amylolactobacillus TaxID=2767876 RepID=A0A1L6XA13_9LACO|nr:MULTISPECIES: DNA primase [Amylolactobacillus]APT17818.1 DNA primase [Amylolactobacillus amylophilus DSM 20533 = JCM 1125]APT19238.1 DNA primase [Amylolactobacillus amylophilus DSM 20533 = JCM 1125]KRK38484.1 DNA primase [Amylolactobacillus amylotrophicus DSM 20534]KRM42873.1 DNA primase [Amylolactobacillus amylophilus DSM 20533 = JCM 1125]GED79737.1 DNA primase [Amylolactobacillus amylophilus]